jgi:hypothetical protein
MRPTDIIGVKELVNHIETFAESLSSHRSTKPCNVDLVWSGAMIYCFDVEPRCNLVPCRQSAAYNASVCPSLVLDARRELHNSCVRRRNASVLLSRMTNRCQRTDCDMLTSLSTVSNGSRTCWRCTLDAGRGYHVIHVNPPFYPLITPTLMHAGE